MDKGHGIPPRSGALVLDIIGACQPARCMKLAPAKNRLQLAEAWCWQNQPQVEARLEPVDTKVCILADMPKATQNTVKHNQNGARDDDVDGRTDDWSSEEEEEDQLPTKSRRTSFVVTDFGQSGETPTASPASDTTGAGETKGAEGTVHGHAPVHSGKGETHRSSSSKYASSAKSCRGNAEGCVGFIGEREEQFTNVRGGESVAPPDVAGWGPREVRRLAYRRGDYTSDPCDVIAELTLDVTDVTSAPNSPDNNSQSLPATLENQKGTSPPLTIPASPPPTITEILEFFKHTLRKLDGVKMLGRTGVLPEDLCILSQLVGPDRYRHKQRVEGIVDMCPESDSADCKQEEGGTETSSMDGRLQHNRHCAAAAILRINMFSLQQRLLLAAREVWFGENLTVYLADKMLNGILGSLALLARTQGVQRNFILDNNPTTMMLVSEGRPDKVLYTGRPDFMIYVRTETTQEPELFCVVQVKKKCPMINSSSPKSKAKMRSAGCGERASKQRLQRIRWHEVGDNSVKKRLADTTFSQAGGELLGHLLLTYSNNSRSCFTDNKYLGIIIHGTKMQLVVAKMKNVDSCLDSIKQGCTKPTKKLCVLYSPNMDYFIPEERQQLLEVLVNLIL